MVDYSCDTCINQYADKCNHCMIEEYHGQRIGTPTNYEQIHDDDAISREKAIKIAKCISKKAMPKYLEQLPSVQPSHKGHWIKTNSGYECSECAIESRSKSDFCQYCGADMRGDTE